MTEITNNYPVLPLRDIVIYPKMIVPLFIGRARSISALELLSEGDYSQIVLVTQKSINQDDPKMEDLYSIGTIGSVLQMLKLPDGTTKILVEGKERVKINGMVEKNGCFIADVESIQDSLPNMAELKVLNDQLLDLFDQYIKLNKKIPADILITLNQIDDQIKLVDTLCSYMPISLTEKQNLLEIIPVLERAEKLLNILLNEMSLLQVEKKIRGRVKKQMEKSQREYYLNEQLKAINKELNDGEDMPDEMAEFENKIKKTAFSKEASQKALSELKKLKNMNPSSAEASVVRNYLDWMLSVPWKKNSKVKNDLNEAEDILNADHHGLLKVKERIMEYLAVQARVGKVKSQILCLVGPPGVGKTSLGQSIAKATGRKFVRMALGGVRDESEIRGHRRTYIGSQPGKIIQGIKKAGTSNPLFLLDEIDKLGSDWRGDPASALLEVLDPEQNASFNDHYLEVDYDLSNVMFVTTANTLNMPQPLLDRMEIIRLSGYTEDEKIEISINHLLPKQKKLHGLKDTEFSVETSAIKAIIRHYTRESGVRSLEREIAKLARKAVREISMNKTNKIIIEDQNIKNYLGIARFKYGMAELEDQIGSTTGLAWTEVGGELLSIETLVMHGKGNLKVTGKLGDVMQESIAAALSYVKSRATDFGIKPPLFEKKDIHIHLPEGAIPKDGPSAGITITTALVSALTGIPVHKHVAMTGEVTLRGHVLPIGGLKEKLLAAHRGGIKTVIIPSENIKDLEEIPENVIGDLKIIPVSSVDDVLKIALTQMPTPIIWDETEDHSLSLDSKNTKEVNDLIH
ncbi:MAG: Lon protease [Holosporales bacterium]